MSSLEVMGVLNWLPSALIGLLFGLAVSGLNYLILKQGIKKGETLPPQKAANTVIARYGMRYVLNIAALFIVHKNVPMLVAAAVGLTGCKNVLLFRELRSNGCKKGVN